MPEPPIRWNVVPGLAMAALPAVTAAAMAGLVTTYQQTSPGFGTLTLSTGSTVVATLTLAGDYTGDTFVTSGAIGNRPASGNSPRAAGFG